MMPETSNLQEFERRLLEFLKKERALLESTWLGHLKSALVELAFKLDRDGVATSDEYDAGVVADVYTRLVNEGWGFIACVENGAFIASLHHARASIELSAGFEHIYRKPSKRNSRQHKYLEYPKVEYYQRFLKDDPVVIERIGLENLKKWAIELVPQWMKIYKPEDCDIHKIRNWHSPARIDNILDDLPGSEIKETYGALCHATHWSPLGVALSRGRLTLGIPKDENGVSKASINQAVIGFIVGMVQIIRSSKEYLNLDFDVSFPDLNMKDLT